MADKEFIATSYYQFLNEKKLMGSKCQKCGTIHLPPKPICNKCYESAMEWVEMKGKGKLAAFSIITVAPTVMIEAGYGRDNPYCVGIVKLEEGPQISAQILKVETREPQKIEIGMPVALEFVERGEGENKRTLPAFKPI